VIRHILNTFGTRVGSAIINLVIAIVISRFLGPAGKGEQGLILATITYIIVFLNLMGGSAIVYLVPRYAYSLIMLPSYIWSIVFSASFYFVLIFTNLVDSQFIIHICFLSALQAITSVNSTILIGKEKIKTANLIAFIQPLIIVISLAVFFMFLGQQSIQSYILSLYISFGISFITSLFYVSKYAGKFKLHPLGGYLLVVRELLRFGVLNQLAHVFQLISFRMSFYWLEDLYSTSEVGIYSNGTSLAESIWLVGRSINLVQYARIANTNDLNYSRQLTIMLSKATLIISIVLLGIMVLLPPGFYVFIFGEGFGEVTNVIRSLAPGILFFNIALIVEHYFSGIGKYHINTMASLIGLIVAIIFFYYLIPLYGITGAGIATSSSYFFTAVFVMVYFMRESQTSLINFMPGKSDMAYFLREIKLVINKSK
jgi:O-antigen/teichoic acid export membrane protein